MTTIHDDDDWEEGMGRTGGGMTCECDIEIALRHGLTACDLIDELVPQQDLHLCEARLGERCEVLDARGGGSYHTVLGFHHVLNDVDLEVIPSHPCVHLRVRSTLPLSAPDIPLTIRNRTLLPPAAGSVQIGQPWPRKGG